MKLVKLTLIAVSLSSLGWAQPALAQNQEENKIAELKTRLIQEVELAFAELETQQTSLTVREAALAASQRELVARLGELEKREATLANQVRFAQIAGIGGLLLFLGGMVMVMAGRRQRNKKMATDNSKPAKQVSGGRNGVKAVTKSPDSTAAKSKQSAKTAKPKKRGRPAKAASVS